jgi:hypothetical protein
MTSEIAVMNQRAIALAADSAVTLIDGGKIVVRNDARKLFQLLDGVPVGAMVFGMGELMGHPWEVLLEHFKKKRNPGKLHHVRDYAAAFTGMLDKLPEFFPPERRQDEYKWLLASVFRFVFRLAHYLHGSGAEGPDEEILRQAIELVWQRYQLREDGSKRPDLVCFPKGTAETVAREQASTIEELIKYGFSAFALDSGSQQKLHDIALWCVTKDLFLEDITGLVFAGFGTDEIYPAVVTCNSSAMIGGILKRSEADVTAIDSEMHSAITLYADSEVTYSFLRGIELDLEARLYGSMEAMCRALVDQVAASFTGIDPAEREAVRRRFQTQLLPQNLRRFYEQISEYQQASYINPILKVLEIATRKDLAETAHDLVALNIFKKKIMAQKQTVGGAIDVAIISRDDGFSWWKQQGG